MANRTDHGSKTQFSSCLPKKFAQQSRDAKYCSLLPIWNFSPRVIIDRGNSYANYKLLSVLLEFNNYCDSA